MGDGQGQSEAQMQERPYRCYLLRCWIEEGVGPNGEPAWRFTVRQTGLDAARCSFISLDDAAAYIAAELATCARVRKGGETGGA
jgi:hypothetical protein